MKKLAILILVATLTTACGANATPTVDGGTRMQPGQTLVCTVK
jgi:hypothetical protein